MEILIPAFLVIVLGLLSPSNAADTEIMDGRILRDGGEDGEVDGRGGVGGDVIHGGV